MGERCECSTLLGQPYQCAECYAWLVPGETHRVPEDCERHRHWFETLITDDDLEAVRG